MTRYICQFCEHEFKSPIKETHCPICTHEVMSEEELQYKSRDLEIEFEMDFELSPKESKVELLPEYTAEEWQEAVGVYTPTKDDPIIVLEIEDVHRLLKSHPDWIYETIREVDEKNGVTTRSFLIYKGE